MISIKFIKDCSEFGNKGDIKQTSEKGANSFVSQGYAEYVIKNTSIGNEGNDISISTVDNEKIDNSNNGETSETSVSTDTGETTDICHLFHLYPVSVPPHVLFQNNLADQILQWFFINKNPAISIADLSEKMGKKKDSIRTSINRYKQFFTDTGSKGRAGVVRISKVGFEEIMARQDAYLSNQQKIKDQEEREKLQQEANESYDSQVATFLMESNIQRNGSSIVIDFSNIAEFNQGLADLFISDPDRFIIRVKDYYQTELAVTIINLPIENCISIEQIRVEHLDKVVSIDGRVTSFGEVKPVILQTNYECPGCGSILNCKQDYKEGMLRDPQRCSCGRCGGFKSLGSDETNACFIQLEDLQEKTDNPHSQRIKAVLFNGLCQDPKIKIFAPGNEVRCSGIIKRVPIFKAGKKTAFTNYIFEIMTAELLEKEIEIASISTEDMQRINELSKKIDEQGLTPLVSSFAPDIYGYENIKGALCLQASNRKNDRGVKSVRNKSNILLVGDPGSAKSVMCEFALSIQNGRKAVGGGSSAVGITASVVKEEDSLGGYRVEPGAMILAKDLLFLDELNNLTDEDKPKLQEGMNEQTVSINKANLHVQMKVTCGTLAAANPKNGHFIEEDIETLIKQFNIPSPILNRFDAIFVLKDNADEETDKKIAEKMIKRHRGKLNPDYDREFLKLFFTYIKQCPDPEINDDTQKLFSNVYALARKNIENTVKINPRFLESLTRLSIAAAKIRQSKIVEVKDIKVAIQILSDSQYKIRKDII